MTGINTAAIETSGLEQRSREVDLGQLLLWSLLAVVALSPLPLGSNRPIAWGATAIGVGAITLWFGVMKLRREETLDIAWRSLALPAVLLGLLAVYLLIQVMPLGAFIDLGTVGRDGWTVELRSLSLAPGATAFMLLQTATYALFFWLMLQAGADPARRRLALNVILAVICAYAALGIVSLRLGDNILGIEKWAYKGSATATFVNRNSFATFVAFGTIIATAQLMSAAMSRGRRDKGVTRTRLFIYGTALVLLLAAIVASNSRMGAFAAICGMTLVAGIYLSRPRRARRRQRWWTLPLFVAGAFVVVAVALLYGGGLIGRLASLDRSLEGRALLYAQVGELIALRPWTGIGGGAFELAFPLVHDAPLSLSAVWDKAHNTYLALWAELGLVFGSIPILLCLGAAILLWRGLRRSAGGLRAQIVALGILLVGGVHSLVDFSLEIQANTLSFLALLALGLAPLLRPVQTEPEPTPPPKEATD